MQSVEFTDTYLKSSTPGETYFIEESAIIEMLAADVLFSNGRPYVENPWDPKEKWCIGPETIVLFVSCNDVFYWATAEAEQVAHSELESLYKMWKADPEVGALKWCCMKRKMRPQWQVEQDWREHGKWDADLESLPARSKTDGG